MNKKLLAFGLLLAFGMTIISCEKDDKEDNEEQEEQSNEPASTPNFEFENYDGRLASIIVDATLSIDGNTFPYSYSVAIASFYENTGDTIGVSAASSMTLENKDLKEEDQGEYGVHYVIDYSTSNLDDIQNPLMFDDTLNWTLTSNGKAWVQDFELDEVADFPGSFDVVSDSIIESGSPYSVSLETSFGGTHGTDSLLFVLSDSQGKFVINYGNSDITSTTFSANQVDQLSNGTIFVQIVSSRFKDISLQNKNIIGVNERAVQVTAEKQ